MAEVLTDMFGNEIVQNELLREKFMEPPFSVLDSKGGEWQKRKRLWKGIGIESHLGREAKCMPGSFGGDLDEAGLDKYGRKPMNETSVFDPALCELLYHWYCPEGGEIIDPFSGGSVRGIVANYLGFKYTGIDIREEQIVSNREQGLQILSPDNQPTWITGDSNVVLDMFRNPVKVENEFITPIEHHVIIDQWNEAGDLYIKRDDKFNALGANGSKARSAHFLIQKAKSEGFSVITTAGSRKSPQINIVAQICEKLNLKFVAHCPEGELSDELKDAQKHGAEIIQHKAGYNSVIVARCKEWALANNAFEVPFGMECPEAINQTSSQVEDIPENIKRIVIVVGSGMNLCGLLHGLKKKNLNIPVVGVQVGKDPRKTLEKYAPDDWEKNVTLIKSELDYHDEEQNNVIDGVICDKIYEAKCIKYLQKDDLFWIVGIRRTLLPAGTPENAFVKPFTIKSERKQFDFVFSCPPYADLEVYSDKPGDISNMPYHDFIKVYAQIIKKAVDVLKPGAYACFVVGDIRDKKGNYFDFISHTKQAFIDAGAPLYNEAILLQPLGTAMLRAAKIFSAGKKLTKVHENVLIFKKKLN